MEVIAKAEYELKRGVTVTVTPITAFARAALLARAAQLIPEPDRTPYEVEVPDAFEPGTLSKAEQSPEWQAKRQAVEEARWQKYIGLLLDTTISHPDRQGLIEMFSETITALRAAFEGQAASDAFVNDWVFLLLNVLATSEEVSALQKIATGATPLTDGELRSGLAYFRSVALQRPDVRAGDDKQDAQGLSIPERRSKRPGSKGTQSGHGSGPTV
jgi:hypothetical protein